MPHNLVKVINHRDFLSIARHILLAAVIIGTVNACGKEVPTTIPVSPIATVSITPSPESVLAADPMVTKPAVTATEKVRPVEQKTEFVQVGDRIPLEGYSSGIEKIISDKELDQVSKIDDNHKLTEIFYWNDNGKKVLSNVDGSKIIVPKPDNLTDGQGSVYSLGKDEIEGHLAKYVSANGQTLYLPYKTNLVQGADYAVLALDGNGEPKIYQKKSDGTIVSAQNLFTEDNKPTDVDTPMVDGDHYVFYTRGEKMLWFDNVNNNWVEAGQVIDSLILSGVSKNWTLTQESGVWKLLADGEVKAVANKNYNEAWMKVIDPEEYTDIYADYRSKYAPKPIMAIGQNNLKQEVNYRVVQSKKINSDTNSQEIYFIDEYGCIVGRQVYLIDQEVKTQPEIIAGLESVRRDFSGYSISTWVQVTPNPLGDRVIRLFNPDTDSLYENRFLLESNNPNQSTLEQVQKLQELIPEEILKMNRPEDIIRAMWIMTLELYDENGGSIDYSKEYWTPDRIKWLNDKIIEQKNGLQGNDPGIAVDRRLKREIQIFFVDINTFPSEYSQVPAINVSYFVKDGPVIINLFSRHWLNPIKSELDEQIISFKTSKMLAFAFENIIAKKDKTVLPFFAINQALNGFQLWRIFVN